MSPPFLTNLIIMIGFKDHVQFFVIRNVPSRILLFGPETVIEIIITQIRSVKIAP